MKLLLKDIKSVKWAIILVIAYFVALKRFIYTICPVTLITGFPCPGCGMTRAFFRLLRFDLLGAWEMHPFIYPIGLLCILFCISRYLLDGKYMEYVKKIMIAIAVGMCLLYIYRMVTMFPNSVPMTYYEDNYINQILFCFKEL